MSAFLSLFILGVLGDVMALGSQLEIVNDNIFTDEQNTLVDHFSMIAELFGELFLHGYDRRICTCGAPLGTHCKWLGQSVSYVVMDMRNSSVQST